MFTIYRIWQVSISPFKDALNANAARSLDGLYQETLRLSSPVPGILPRQVPASGAMCCGYYLAPDVSHLPLAIRN